MSSPPYMKLFWGDYAKATRHLRHAREHGAYLLLIGALWDNEGRLPNDDQTLADYALVSLKEWEALKPKLLPLFKVVRGHLTHKRVTEDLAAYDDTIRKRKAAGKSGGKAKARNQREKPEALAKQTPPYSESESESDKSPIAPKGASVRQVDVEAVWAITPDVSRRRSGKEPLRQALDGVAKVGHAPAVVQRGLEGYFASDEATRDGGKFVAGVHRLVKGGRWESFVAELDPQPTLFTPHSGPEDPWPRRVGEYMRNAYWNRLDWGPPPGKPGCAVSEETLAAAGFEPNNLLSFPGRPAA